MKVSSLINPNFKLNKDILAFFVSGLFFDIKGKIFCKKYF